MILDLWAHVRAFPAARAPFDSIDRVIETIESLHPDGAPHYRNDLWRALDDRAADGDTEVELLLKTALGIDGAARNLIHHVLAHASTVAGRESAEWLELAQQLQEEDPLTELRVRIVGAGWDEVKLHEHRRAKLEKRIAQLEHFAAAADDLKKSLVGALVAAQAASQMAGGERAEPNA